MAAILRFPGGTNEVAEIVEALLVAADAKEKQAPELALRWRWLADDLGDALDQLPTTQQ